MKHIFFFLSILFILTLFPQSVFAHVLKSDGSIGAVLHVNPEDDPIAGEMSSFSFEFKDTQKLFNLDKCTCTIAVYQNGKEIYSQKFTNASFTFTFPEKDIYQVTIKGVPSVAKAFQPFTLSYDVHVASASSNDVKTDESSLVVYLVLAGIVIILIIIYILKRIVRAKKQKQPR